MTNGLDALTEKEKQTLRLIVQGYDAKSLAGHLGISVYTVNERLREARRKLAVSSSREAARILSRAEAAPPQFLADKQLGEAAAREPVEQASPPEAAAPKSRRPLILGGLAVMSVVLAAFALATQAPVATMQAGAAATPAADAPVSDKRAAVTSAAEAFLSRVDARDWQGSYAATTRSFHNSNTEAAWAEASEKVYPSPDTLRSRTLASADFAPAPPDGSWIVKFHTSFAKRGNVTEIVALVREDGVYKVAGIFVE